MNADGKPTTGTHAGPQRGSGGRRQPLPQSQRCALLLALCGLVSAGAAHADNAADCSIDTSAAAIAFGTYDPLSALPLDAAGQIDVTCKKNKVVVRVELDRGGSGSYLPRRMQSGIQQTLAYNLYLDSTRSIVFGDGTGGTQAGAGMTSANGHGEFLAQVQVYGRIAPGLDAAAGSYSDRIIVTVTF